MARNQEVLVVADGQIVELTNDDVERITFQVLSGHVEIRVGLTVEGQRGQSYREEFGERQKPLAELSEAGGSRVFAIGRGHPESKVFVDHA